MSEICLASFDVGSDRYFLGRADVLVRREPDDDEDEEDEGDGEEDGEDEDDGEDDDGYSE